LDGALGDLRREALRVHSRYLDEVVRDYGLCPWADRAMRDGRVRRHVITDAAPPPEAALAFIDTIEAQGAGIGVDVDVDVGFIIYPRLALTAAAFDGYTERLRRADQTRRLGSQRPAFLMAAFHPFGAERFATPFQMVSFIRRTPDPTIQLVRADLLEAIRAERDDVSAEVARQNHTRVSEKAAAALDTLLRDIRADRDAVYASLGLDR
jgi:hypothetical protein